MTYTYKLSRRLAVSHDPLSDLRKIMLFLLLLLAISCGDGSTGPSHPDNVVQPGWLSVALTTPNANDGVVQLSLAGGRIDSLEVTGGQGFAMLVNGAGRLLVTGDVGSGVVARMWVPDTRAFASYSGSVEAAAARSTYQLQDITPGYSVHVTR